MKRCILVFLAAAVLPARAAALQVDSAAPQVDRAALLADVRTLASAQYAGRKTGSDGSRLAQAYLQARFEQVGLKSYGGAYAQPFSFATTSKAGVTTRYPAAVNYVGYLAGSGTPARVIVVSAHYDHLGVQEGRLYPGADDNASGVAALLALAAWFKAHPPQHTIVFAAFDGEELGLRGAKAFLAALPFPKEQLALNLNLDMLSHNDHNEIFVAGTSHTPTLKPLVAQAAARAAVKVRFGHDIALPGAPPGDDWTGSSDHGPFHDAGIAFLYFGVEDHRDYHAVSDSYAHINQAFYGRVANLLVDVAETLDKNLDAK